MPRTPSRDPIDFDLHGFVRVRLLDAGPDEVAAVRHQLGPIEAPVTGDADITCRFVDRLEITRPVRSIGLDEAAFTDDAYLILRSRHKAPARVQVPIADVGGPCEIVCERGLPAVPLLIAIINVTALAKGHAPIHASAFTHDGRGVMVAGWAKGGKTETLLGFMAHGARYVGDEWLYLAPDGSQMFGIPEPMKIWASHLAAMPVYRHAASRAQTLRLGALAAAVGLARGAAGGGGRRGPVSRVARRGLPLLEQRAYLHLAPERLFGPDRCDLRGPLDVVVLAVTHDDPRVIVQETDAAEVARRMVFSVEHERLDLLAHYLRFRFAFPGSENTHLESSGERQAQLFARALHGKRALALYHPYPAPIPAMYEALRPCLR